MPEHAAPDATLESANGPVTLSSLWANGPLVLVFLRHLG
jgi:hypothetical protein